MYGFDSIPDVAWKEGWRSCSLNYL